MTYEGSEDLLETALTHAFQSPLIQQQQQPSASFSTTVTSEPTAAVDASSEDASDAWKTEYEAQLKTWKIQSAEAREKAEKERERWESIRTAEKAAGKNRQPLTTAMQSVGLKPAVISRSASNAARTPPGSTDDIEWRDIQSSITSSYPSLSFPGGGGAPSRALFAAAQQHTAPLATLSAFDATLSTRTRLIAIASSVAINLFLPFINGVMLGFGEIFAKNVVMVWFGWKVPGSTETRLGLGTSGRKARAR